VIELKIFLIEESHNQDPKNGQETIKKGEADLFWRGVKG
jgi:hypothetical protein